MASCAQFGWPYGPALQHMLTALSSSVLAGTSKQSTLLDFLSLGWSAHWCCTLTGVPGDRSGA
jgi:hypothetical protein